LSSSGQEADCTARITVTPLGMVSKVEIMNTSGYTEIDAGVVSALRGYVFSRDYGVEKRNAVAVVMFRFRLETLD
jgi:outer membrane biosynthesis protein TonB